MSEKQPDINERVERSETKEKGRLNLEPVHYRTPVQEEPTRTTEPLTEGTARTEHARDKYPDLDEHYKAPWAMVVRVEGETCYPGGEPTERYGEAMVRLVNPAAHNVPEAMMGVPPISLAIGHPWVILGERGAEYDTLGGIQLHPRQAIALADAIREAAVLVLSRQLEEQMAGDADASNEES